MIAFAKQVGNTPSCMVRLFLLIFFLLFPVLPQAQPAHIPNALWESKPLPGAIMAIAVGDVDGDGEDELVTVDERNVSVFSVQKPLVYTVETTAEALPLFSYENTALQPIATKKIDKKTAFFRIHVGDWDHDEISEILLTGFQMGRGYSVLYQLKDGELKKTKEFSEAVLPVGLELRTQSVYPSGDLSTGPDLFSAHFILEQIVILSPDNHLQLYKGKKRLWKSSLTYGGAVGFVPFKHKDALGLNQTRHFSIQPRIVSHDSDVYLVKNEAYLDAVIGTVPRVKTAQLVVMGLTESTLTEKHVSPRYQGAITDLALIDWDGDGNKEVIFSFLINQFGYLTKDKGYNSVLAIVSLTIH